MLAKLPIPLVATPDIVLVEPQGAFYPLVRISGMPPSPDFVNGGLVAENVGLAPDDTFWPGNEEYIRLCLAQPPACLEQALDRIVR